MSRTCMQVSVTNVHVRLEDELSHSEEGVATGVAMEMLSIRNPEVHIYPLAVTSVPNLLTWL